MLEQLVKLGGVEIRMIKHAVELARYLPQITADVRRVEHGQQPFDANQRVGRRRPVAPAERPVGRKVDTAALDGLNALPQRIAEYGPKKARLQSQYDLRVPRQDLFHGNRRDPALTRAFRGYVPRPEKLEHLYVD